MSGLVLPPVLSGLVLLLVTTSSSETVQDALNTLTSPVPGLSAYLNGFTCAKTVLTTVASLVLMRQLNRMLNVISHNAWSFKARDGWDWKKEIAVVTGGSSGIGHSIVEKLVANSIRVAVLDIQDMPKPLQQEPLVHFFQCDVTSTESVAAAAEAVRKKLGHPSILINNAGIAPIDSVLDVSESKLRKIFDVNCLALWFTTQQFLPDMIKKNHGHIVTIASIASFVGLPIAAHYSATKAGAHAFHETLTSEIKFFHKAPGILTTVLHPTFIRTPLIDEFKTVLDGAPLPVLQSDAVADAVWQQLKARRGGQVVVPRSMSFISGFRAWPHWLQRAVRDDIAKNADKLVK